MADNCAAVLEKLGTLSSADIADILDYIDKFKGQPIQPAAVQAKIQEALETAANIERQAPFKAAVRVAWEAKYLQAAKEAIATGQGKFGRKVKDLSDALSSFLVGTNKDMAGAQASVDKMAKASAVSRAGELVDRMAQSGIPDFVSLANDKVFTRELIHAMAGEGTKDELANKAAGILTQFFREGIDRMNAAGANIKELNRYMFAQEHSPGKLAKAGFAQWAKDIQGAIKPTVYGHDDPQEVLHEIYQDIIQGKYGDVMEHGPTTANLANAVSRHRTLQFKDADSALAYNEKYGTNTPIYNLVMHAMKQGKDAVFLEQLGPNPGQFFEWAKSRVQGLSRKLGVEVTSKQIARLDREFNALTGVQNQVASYNLAHNAETFRAGLMMAHLGTSAISSFSDASNGLINLWRAGRPLWSSLGMSIKTFFKFFGNTATLGQAFKAMTPETMHALRSIPAGYDAAIHYMTSRFGLGADVNESSARMLGWFFKLNRQAYWDDLFKSMTSHAIANTMAENAGKEFADLPDSMQHSLYLAGLQKHWDALRTSEITEVGGHRYLTPDKVTSKAARDLYQTYLLEQAERTVPLPGAKQVAAMHIGAMGGKRGQWMTELHRTIMMFKAFPLGIAQKVWPNAQDMGLPGIATFLAGSVAMGYASSSVKNLLAGKEPNDPESPHTWVEALAAGGGLSLAGDIFGANKMETLSDVFGGPGLQTLNDAFKIGTAAMQPGATQTPLQAAAAPSIHFLQNDIPFTNLWFTKLAYQYNVIYPLMETAHPGANAKMVNELKQKYNEDFWLRPKGAQ